MNEDVDKVIDEIRDRGERLLDEVTALSDRDQQELFAHLEAVKARQDATLAIIEQMIKKREDDVEG